MYVTRINPDIGHGRARPTTSHKNRSRTNPKTAKSSRNPTPNPPFDKQKLKQTEKHSSYVQKSNYMRTDRYAARLRRGRAYAVTSTMTSRQHPRVTRGVDWRGTSCSLSVLFPVLMRKTATSSTPSFRPSCNSWLPKSSALTSGSMSFPIRVSSWSRLGF